MLKSGKGYGLMIALRGDFTLSLVVFEGAAYDY